MIRQYYAQRCRGGDNPLRVGVIPSGAIFYIQDHGWWRDRDRGAPICRNPWIVEGFLNGVLCAARRNRDTGHWEDAHMAGRSDMAIVRSLRDGRRRQVAVHILILHEDEGLRRDTATYPDLPTTCLRARNRPGHSARHASDTSRRACQFARNHPATSGEVHSQDRRNTASRSGTRPGRPATPCTS
jgi:hypothetical protein